jgi:uncharacterized membrane protein
MPVLTNAADALTRKLPKVIEGKAHLAVDYAVGGSLLAAGTWFWRRKRRAALGALVSGASCVGLALLTSYPGRKKKTISFPLHGKIETGLAAMIATMPEFLRIEGEREKRYFLTTAGILTVASNLTRFDSRPSH